MIQLPSALEMVEGFSFRVQNCAESVASHSAMYKIWEEDSGTTPLAVIHQSPYAICEGTPEPETM